MKNNWDATFGDFKCKHCGNFVSVNNMFSGVVNRNHCPYCLWSRHLDLYQPGDRLSACKGNMQPVGLTLKKRRKKYVRENTGELMVVHRCQECGKLVANRIAADDDVDLLSQIFQRSRAISAAERLEFERQGIALLTDEDSEVVRARLFGRERRPDAFELTFAG